MHVPSIKLMQFIVVVWPCNLHTRFWSLYWVCS